MNADVKAYIFRTVRRFIVLAVLAVIVQFGMVPIIRWLLTVPHPLLEGLRQHIVQHLAEYLGFLGVLSIAFVCTWPPLIPKTGQDWWTWFRDAFQTAIPAARAGHSNQIPPQNPTPPVDPAQPK